MGIAQKWKTRQQPEIPLVTPHAEISFAWWRRIGFKLAESQSLFSLLFIRRG
jgi:hypothetical protein